MLYVNYISVNLEPNKNKNKFTKHRKKHKIVATYIQEKGQSIEIDSDAGFSRERVQRSFYVYFQECKRKQDSNE